jgi:photosystem II stability/assembly factor-like uncharacterized protein
MKRHSIVLAAAYLAAAILAAATPRSATAAGAAAPASGAGATFVPERVYGALSWRLIGPFRGGWATIAAGVPGDPATWYFGSADGGVWKTTDAGVTWRPLFNDQGSASIGALAIAPSDPKVIWAGTGQIHQRWDIASGDGVYLSTDGGASWRHVGLEATRHIGSIWVDPKDPSVAVVAALGHVFGPNDERGVYRTADAGATWTRVLQRGPDVGAVDIASDPGTPDLLYASLWQVRRHPWLDYFQPPEGPGSGIYKSIDGGRTWSPAGTAGLPKIMGRIDLGVAPKRGGKRVWAGVDAKEGGGLYRSDDGGATWTRINPDTSLAGSYMNCISPDPIDPDVVWAAGRGLRRSLDGGKNFTFVKGAPGGDDYHYLYIDPKEPRRMILAADQGAAVSLNGGATWSSWYNQPTGQFYRLAADDRFPYRIYSGQQDSGTVGITARSDYGQITFRDWNPVGGDERDGDVPAPGNPGIVYGAGLGGRLSRWDERTGQVQNVSPWPVSTYGQRPVPGHERYSWITPLAISKRPPHAIYQGTQKLYRSTDEGSTWRAISGDLTGAASNATACSGDVPVERATACGYGVIFAIAPSTAADGVVWIGTDNGRVQVTRDEGRTWTNVTPPGMTDWTKVNLIDLSPDDPAVAYVSADRHRLDDVRPLAWWTHDYGATWTDIARNLPQDEWVGVVRHDPKQPWLLYTGTNRGVRVSFDKGENWQSLQLNLPRTGINDLLVRGDDLIVATQGRAIWALDGIQPLRFAPGAAASSGPYLVPPADAVRLRANLNRDTPLPPEEPRGENPPTGAVIDYVLPSAPGGSVILDVLDASGAVLRTFRSDDAAKRPTEEVYFAEAWLTPAPLPTARLGHNRFVWDLRLAPPQSLEPEYAIAAVPGQMEPALPAGAFVLPGDYRVRLTAGGALATQPLRVVQDPRVTTGTKDLEALFAFQREVEATLARSATLEGERSAAQKRLKEALKDPASAKNRSAVEHALAEMETVSGPADERPAKVNQTLSGLASDLELADAAPTAPQRQVLIAFREGLERFATRWKGFASTTLKEIDRRLGAPQR